MYKFTEFEITSMDYEKFHAVKCGGQMPDIEKLQYVGCCAIFVQQELMLYIFEELA